MSFTKIASKEVKLRCWRCGSTRNVWLTDVNCLCRKCRRLFGETPDLDELRRNGNVRR